MRPSTYDKKLWGRIERLGLRVNGCSLAEQETDELAQTVLVLRTKIPLERLRAVAVGAARGEL